MKPRRVANLLLWCAENGIQIDERLEIRESLRDGSISVFSKAGPSIAIGESLVRIPKSAVFSVKNCSRSREIPVGIEDPTLELSLAFLIETSIGLESRWYGYFSSLPEDGVEIAPFWGVNGDRDGTEALKWLQGTEASRLLKGRRVIDRIYAYFRKTVKVVLDRLRLPSLLEDFLRAYSIISSRAFLIDTYHGLSLVPVADAFNHIEDNHIHLQSDYHVCPACGSLDECDHDAESPNKSPVSVSNRRDTCDMVANLPICPNEEIFNSYEKGLTNAELLCQYGFILDVNENNLVTWSVDELLCDKPKETRHIWERLVAFWPNNPNWDDLQLVYNHRRSEDYEDGVPTLKRALWKPLDINADGQISHQLWLLLYTLALPSVDIGFDDALFGAQQVARAQEQLERLNSEGNILDHGSMTDECRSGLGLLRIVAEGALQICIAKNGTAYYTGMATSQIGDMLDELPANRRLTRLAISYSLEERKIVQACHTAWSEFAELVMSAVS